MRKKPLLLDTYCKAGGCSVGYARAGFRVVGVDKEPQPNYPFEFYQGDAIEFIEKYGRHFDVIAGSPPCQSYTKLEALTKSTVPKLIIPTREAMIRAGKPYVIENVESKATYAEMVNPIRLCGSSFNLRVRRHRLFESNLDLSAPPCDHGWQDASPIYKIRRSKSRGGSYMSGVAPVYGHGGKLLLEGFDTATNMREELRIMGEAMGIDWMTREELVQAIPPAFTEFLGRQIIRLI